MGHSKHNRMVRDTKLLLSQIVEGLKLPEPEEEFKTRLESCEEAELVKQKEATIYQMRVTQFKALGFHPFSNGEAVKFLKGEPHTKTIDGDKRLNYDYHFRHNEYTVTKGDKCTWGVSNPTSYIREERQGSWFLPPFSKQIVWTVEPVYKLDSFLLPIPADLLTALNFMRTKGFFNSYLGYQCKNTKDAIILGNIAELAPGDNSTGDSTYFYVGSFLSEPK